jgi:hypothetical protein
VYIHSSITTQQTTYTHINRQVKTSYEYIFLQFFFHFVFRYIILFNVCIFYFVTYMCSEQYIRMNTSTTLQNAQNQKGSQYEVGVKKL